MYIMSWLIIILEESNCFPPGEKKMDSSLLLFNPHLSIYREMDVSIKKKYKYKQQQKKLHHDC